MSILSKDLLFEVASDDGMLIWDGLDEAILGLASRCGENTVVAYDIDKIIEILIKDEGMSYIEAIEYYSFHLEGAHLGDSSPIFIRLIGDE